ncbi:unnamed protein product [Dicrocoelium dendriticum]|nr:unnamed protein product [Dicrocoelium dendriticum]
MNPSANRERVLLSLKWFTHRMIRSFEEKLAHAVSGLSHSRTYLSAHISPNPTPPSAVSRQHICNTDETNEIPLLNQLLEQQHRMRKRLSFESGYACYENWNPITAVSSVYSSLKLWEFVSADDSSQSWKVKRLCQE